MPTYFMQSSVFESDDDSLNSETVTTRCYLIFLLTHKNSSFRRCTHPNIEAAPRVSFLIPFCIFLQINVFDLSQKLGP